MRGLQPRRYRRALFGSWTPDIELKHRLAALQGRLQSGPADVRRWFADAWTRAALRPCRFNVRTSDDLGDRGSCAGRHPRHRAGERSRDRVAPRGCGEVPGWPRSAHVTELRRQATRPSKLAGLSE